MMYNHIWRSWNRKSRYCAHTGDCSAKCWSTRTPSLMNIASNAMHGEPMPILCGAANRIGGRGCVWRPSLPKWRRCHLLILCFCVGSHPTFANHMPTICAVHRTPLRPRHPCEFDRLVGTMSAERNLLKENALCGDSASRPSFATQRG